MLHSYCSKPPVVIVGVDQLLLYERFIEQLYAAVSVHRPYIVVVVDSLEEQLIVNSLQQGADRAIATPVCNAEIFTALIRSLLPKSRSAYCYSPYRLDTLSQTVSIGEVRVHLRRRLYDIAHYLFLNNGKMLPKKMLLKELWGLDEHICETRRVEQQVSLTKKSLALDGTYGWKLRSVRGTNRGYGLFRVSKA